MELLIKQYGMTILYIVIAASLMSLMWLTFTGEFSTLTADANQESYADNSNLKNLPKPKLVVKNATYDKAAVTGDNLDDLIRGMIVSAVDSDGTDLYSSVTWTHSIKVGKEGSYYIKFSLKSPTSEKEVTASADFGIESDSVDTSELEAITSEEET